MAQQVQTPYLARIDADDICEFNRFELQLAFLNQHPEYSIVSSSCSFINDMGQNVCPRSEYARLPEDIRHASLRASRIVHPAVMMRASSLARAGGYRDLSTHECQYWPEDYDLWLRMLSHGHAIALPEKLLKYCYNSTGLSEKEMSLNRAALGRRRAWLANAAQSAGIDDQAEALRLWDAQKAFALPRLNKIAHHFGHMDRISLMERWKMPSFQKAAVTFVHTSDLATRLWIRLASGLSRQ